MINLLKNIQNKPEGFKRAVMWFGVFAVMAAIFTFWLITFPSQTQNIAESDATADLKRELPTAFSDLKSQVSELFNLFK